MKIIGWTEWDDPNHKEMFRDGGSYKAEDVDEAIKVISEELRKNGYKFSGIYHQNGDFGVPIFDNGEVFQCSQRMWGESWRKHTQTKSIIATVTDMWIGHGCHQNQWCCR